MVAKMRFLFFTLGLLMITQPGAIAFANFDAPYGLYNDLSAWLSAYLGGGLFLFLYGLISRKKLGGTFLSFYFLHYVALLSFTYFLQRRVIGGINPSFSFLNFLALIFLSFLLALMLFVPSLFSPPYYLYDRPLILLQLGIWLVCFLIFLKLREFEEEKRFLPAYGIFLGLFLFSTFLAFLKVILG